MKRSDGTVVTYEQFLCYCCYDPPKICPPCCSEFQGGTFNDDGDLEFTIDDLIVVVILPTKNERYFCPGSTIRFEFKLADGSYMPTESYFPWIFEHDLAWEKVTFGDEIDDSFLLESPGYYEFATVEPFAHFELLYNGCWADWDLNYGVVQITSVLTGDSITILSPPCEASKGIGIDCCLCQFDCVECCWYFPCDLPEPDRPEVYEGAIAYVAEGPHDDLLMAQIDLPLDERRFCRPETPKEEGEEFEPSGFNLRLKWFPPIDYEERFGEAEIEFCVQHIGLKSSGPRVEDCYPDPFVEVDDICATLTRWELDPNDVQYERDVDLSAFSCEDDCEFDEPQTIIVTVHLRYQIAGEVAVRDYNISREIEIASCPNPNEIDCRCPKPCCENLDIDIDHPDGDTAWTIDATPDDGFLETGTFDAPLSLPNAEDGTWQVQCHPPDVPRPQFWILTASAGNNPGVSSGIQPVTSTLQVVWEPNQGYPPITITVSCLDDPEE
jgi:hypothetical protein